MHKNTYLLVSALAVIAAFLFGVNIGRGFKQAQTSQTNVSPAVTIGPSPSVATSSATKLYRNEFCNVSFDYPADLTVLENASGSAAFSGASSEEGILLSCQKNIPRPALEEARIEDIRIGSVAAKLYHAQSAINGSPIDSLIFRHPGTQLDVFLAGTSELFRTLISTLRLLP